MAIKSTLFTVGATPTLLDAGTTGTQDNPVTVIFSVPSGGVTVYIGGPDVSSTNGFPVAAGTSSPAFDLIDDPIYAIVASSTQNVNLFRRGL